MIVGDGSVAEVSVHVDSVFDDEETRGHSSFLGSEREFSRDRVRDLESNDRCGVRAAELSYPVGCCVLSSTFLLRPCRVIRALNASPFFRSMKIPPFGSFRDGDLRRYGVRESERERERVRKRERMIGRNRFPVCCRLASNQRMLTGENTAESLHAAASLPLTGIESRQLTRQFISLDNCENLFRMTGKHKVKERERRERAGALELFPDTKREIQRRS